MSSHAPLSHIYTHVHLRGTEETHTKIMTHTRSTASPLRGDSLVHFFLFFMFHNMAEAFTFQSNRPLRISLKSRHTDGDNLEISAEMWSEGEQR